MALCLTILYFFICRYVNADLGLSLRTDSYIHQYFIIAIEYSEPLIKDTPTKDMPKALLYKLYNMRTTY